MQFFWINSTLGLTLDTEYVTVTQYNGSAITGTTVVNGDVSTLNPETVSEAYAIVSTIPIPPPYGHIGGPSFVLADGRDGKINDALSVPYPTPYFGIAGIQIFSQTVQSQVSRGALANNCPLATFIQAGLRDDSLSSTWIEFSNTFYEVLTCIASEQYMKIDFEINTISFSSWVMTNASIASQYPQLSHCTWVAPADGPPGFKIPVSALTGTTTTTVQGTSHMNTQLPKPANTLTSTAARQTLSPQMPTLKPTLLFLHHRSSSTSFVSSLPEKSAKVSQPAPENTPSTSIVDGNGQETLINPSSTPSDPQRPNPIVNSGGPSFKQSVASPVAVAEQTLNPGASVSVVDNTPGSSATAGDPVVIGSDMQVLPGKQSSTEMQVPVLTYDGSSRTADASSRFVLGDHTLAPGGAVTMSGTAVSLASDASYAVVGDQTQALTAVDVGPTAIASSEAPVLVYAGETYTASGSSPYYVIASQTLTPNGAITVSGIPISLASGGSTAVIGSSTQVLATKALPTPTTRAQDQQLIFGGQTYTASGPSPTFLIVSQTLTPDGAVTVSGTTIILPSGASVAVIGSSTQTLANAPTVREITLGDNIYTADSASNFEIAGQTLTPGGLITVSGTKVSYASQGTDVVVGSSTEAVNLGTIIMGGFGQPSQTGSASGAVTFTGGAREVVRLGGGYWLGLAVWLVVPMY